MKEGEVVTIKGKQYLCMNEGKLAEILRFQDGVPVLKTQVITKEEGVDEHGTPKRSVEIRVPCLTIGMIMGNNG
jgi:hypothetical protein